MYISCIKQLIKKKGKTEKMKTKNFAKVSTRILVALLVFTMVITAVSTTLFTTVSADEGVFWQNDSIKTNYEKYLNGSVVHKLPDAVKDDEENDE